MTIAEWLHSATRKLAEVEISSARLDSLLLLEHVLKQDRARLQAHDEAGIDVRQLAQLNTLLLRRSKREPLAYITGHKEFMGLNFNVNHSVLIPRPETEVFVEAAIEKIPPKAKVVEIGTGSGCIAVSLKHMRSDLKLTATDISPKALSVASRNAQNHGVEIDFINSDLFSHVDGRFDAVLANLPYVPKSTRHEPELNFEPRLALFAGDDGLALYRRFFDGVWQFLLPNGLILIEAGPSQRHALEQMLPAGRTLSAISEYVFAIDLE